MKETKAKEEEDTNAEKIKSDQVSTWRYNLRFFIPMAQKQFKVLEESNKNMNWAPFFVTLCKVFQAEIHATVRP